jgi:tRNA (adenine22-N1)-methyltransferase
VVPLRLPKLDERLQAAADLFPPCRLGADIGTDHGRLPLYLLASGRCERMVVSDISAPALSKARELIIRHRFDQRAAFIQADGLDSLAEPAQAVSLLGMGGDTMCAILTAAPQKLHGAALILSPHTELYKVREVLHLIGYRIEKESVARSGGRFYVILQAVPGDAVYTEKELLLGPCIIRERPPLFQDYLCWRQRVADIALKALKDAGDEEGRLTELKRLDAYIREELP